MENVKNDYTVGRVLKIIFMSLLSLLALSIIVGYLLGFRALIVNGASMEPIISYRSLAIDYKPQAKDFKIGDAVTYKTATGTSFITHQLIRVTAPDQTILAEFRDMANYEEAWETGDAYIIELNEYGENVVAWYSGQEFTENDLFVMQGTNFTLTPFDGSPDAGGVGFTFDRIYGKVIFAISGFGNLILFIQKQIILIVASVAILFILFNMYYNGRQKRQK